MVMEGILVILQICLSKIQHAICALHIATEKKKGIVSVQELKQALLLNRTKQEN